MAADFRFPHRWQDINDTAKLPLNDRAIQLLDERDRAAEDALTLAGTGYTPPSPIATLFADGYGSFDAAGVISGEAVTSSPVALVTGQTAPADNTLVHVVCSYDNPAVNGTAFFNQSSASWSTPFTSAMVAGNITIYQGVHRFTSAAPVAQPISACLVNWYLKVPPAAATLAAGFAIKFYKIT